MKVIQFSVSQDGSHEIAVCDDGNLYERRFYGAGWGSWSRREINQEIVNDSNTSTETND